MPLVDFLPNCRSNTGASNKTLHKASTVSSSISKKGKLKSILIRDASKNHFYHGEIDNIDAASLHCFVCSNGGDKKIKFNKMSSFPHDRLVNVIMRCVSRSFKQASRSSMSVNSCNKLPDVYIKR